jgi:hypothetical protein
LFLRRLKTPHKNKQTKTKNKTIDSKPDEEVAIRGQIVYKPDEDIATRGTIVSNPDKKLPSERKLLVSRMRSLPSERRCFSAGCGIDRENVVYQLDGNIAIPG